MEIKHTVEILTKDIQEIEKLVRNLNNSPTPPKIELDLALAKLRNVYELLSLIREDMDQLVVPEQNPVAQVTKQVEEQIEEVVIEQATEKVPEQVREQEPEPQSILEKQPVQAEIQMEAPAANKEEITQQVQEAEIKPEPQSEPLPVKKEAEILAEKFSNDPSINENIASATKTADISSKITAQPIDNIGRNIGINDRFLIIRELFEGDNDNYTQLITQLDSSTNEQEALGLLEIKFPEAAEHEGFQLLAQLAKRKFISG